MTTMINTNPLEDDIAREFMICPDCGKDVHTRPAEKVPAQQLRACNECDAVFNMDMSARPRYTPLPEEEADPRAARIAELEAALRALTESIDTFMSEAEKGEHIKAQAQFPIGEAIVRKLKDQVTAARQALNSNVNSDKETE